MLQRCTKTWLWGNCLKLPNYQFPSFDICFFEPLDKRKQLTRWEEKEQNKKTQKGIFWEVKRVEGAVKFFKKWYIFEWGAKSTKSRFYLKGGHCNEVTKWLTRATWHGMASQSAFHSLLIIYRRQSGTQSLSPAVHPFGSGSGWQWLNTVTIW